MPPSVAYLSLYLGPLQMAVLLTCLRNVNWSDKHQGGVRGFFRTDESIAEELTRDRSNVSRARRRLVELGILRDATPQETAKVLADANIKGPGRKPQVQVFTDTSNWTVFSLPPVDGES